MEDSTLLWNKAKEKIKEDHIFPPEAYKELIEPINTVFKETNTTLFLIVENNLIKFRLDKFYIDTINEVMINVSDEVKRVKFITADEAKKEKEFNSNFAINQVSSLELNKSQRKLRGEYTFENFVMGVTNRYAYITAMKVAEEHDTSINPLYIFGDVGLGKTHLMTAIGHYILDNDPKKNVIYTTAQQFTEDYFNSLTKKDPKKIQEFSDYYRTADVLLFDDVQFLANKTATQEEFFKLFEYLYNKNIKIVITSDRKPEDLENIMSRLKSRFSMGIPVDIQKPDFELRKAIIKKKLKDLISDPDSVDSLVIDFIASSFVNNIREIEGALRRFINYCVSFNLKYTLENAKTSLNSIISTSEEAIEEMDYANINKVKKVVAKYYNISVSDLSASTRKAEIVLPRQIAIYLVKTIYDTPLSKIGEYFGNRDHTTISYACNKVEQLIQNDWTVKQDIENLRKNLG